MALLLLRYHQLFQCTNFLAVDDNDNDNNDNDNDNDDNDNDDNDLCGSGVSSLISILLSLFTGN